MYNWTFFSLIINKKTFALFIVIDHSSNGACGKSNNNNKSCQEIGFVSCGLSYILVHTTFRLLINFFK